MKTRTHLRGQNNSSEIRVKKESLKQDEVVKYMSKLPGYLQGEESSDHVLNVGVLDWSRLEKWKHCRGGKRESKLVSSTCTLGTTVPNAYTHRYHHNRCSKIVNDQVHASSLLGKVKAASRGGLQHPVSNCTLDPEFIASRDDDTSAFNNQEIATCSYNYNKSSRKSRKLPEMGNSAGSLAAKESEKTARGNQCVDNKLDREEKTVGEENHSNIVLLGSRKQSHKYDNVKKVVTSRDGIISNSLGLTSQAPPPLSFDLERDSEAAMGLPLGVAITCKKEQFGGTTKTASRIFDQEKKRHTSPSNKSFSFSFGRLSSTSFTFKEDSSSAAQPLTSFSSDDTKSYSMRCVGSANSPSQSGNPEEEKHCRVSPLRRLLDHPLLKSKGSEKNVLPSKERSASSKPKPKPKPKPTNMDEKKKQQHTSRRTQALFQLTTRNGIPLFQFVVDDDDNLNNRSILGATMKNSAASSFKDDSVQYCTFYSVDEVVKKKKKGSWLIHGHKEKQQRGFVYNVIGQMRLCNSEKGSESVSSIIREAVLVDETEQVVKGRKEVAAVVIKKHAEENLGETTTVIIPGGVHSFPDKGAPTPLISRWRSGGCCDCGGWDVGCKLHLYRSYKTTLLHDLDRQSFKLFAQGECDQDSGCPVLEMTELKTGIYRLEFDSFLSHLQAFFVCVTFVTCASDEETVSKTTGKSSSPFAPPLSPVGRV